MHVCGLSLGPAATAPRLPDPECKACLPRWPPPSLFLRHLPAIPVLGEEARPSCP